VKIKKLRPGMSDINVLFQVLSKDRPRKITSRHSGETHRIAEVKVGDETGTVIVPLWDDSIQMVKRGKTYLLKKGYTDEYRGSLRLKIGKHSEFGESDCEIEDINYRLSKSSNDPLQRYYRKIDTHYRGRLGVDLLYNDPRGHQ
jgi:replication factor A1